MSNRLILPLIALVSACASAQVMRVDTVQRPATSPDSIRVFLDEPNTPYESIALIEISDQGWGISLEDLKTRLAKEAAKLGGNGVIIGRHTTDSDALVIPVGDTFSSVSVETIRLAGKVIVFR